MAHSGVPGASLLSANPKYNPLGTFGTDLPDIAAAASEIVAPGNPYGIATFLAKGGFDLSQGNTLGGILNIGSAGLAGIPDIGSLSTAAAPASGGGASAASIAPSGVASAANDTGLGFDPSVAASGTAGTSSLPGSFIAGSTPAPTADMLAAVSPEAGLGGPAAAGIPAVGNAPGLFGQIGQNLGVVAPQQGLNPIDESGLGLAGTGASATGAGSLAGPSAGTTPAGPTFGQAAKTLFTNPSLGNLGTLASTIPASAYLGAGALGYEATQANKPLPYQSQLTGEAAQLASQGAEFANILSTGQLPAGAQSALDQAAQAAQAAIRSQYANMGLTGSTMETQALNNVQQQAAAQKFTIADQLVTQGISEGQAAAGLYQQLMAQELQQDQALGTSIGNFAASLGGGQTFKIAPA